MIGDGSTIGCGTCWLDPKIPGEKIKPICVIFAGNGYCIDHWQAVNHLTEKARTGPVALVHLDSLPLLLSGHAVEAKL